MMETKKITNIQGDGTFESQHGTLYKFSYEFDDATQISANHKSNSSPHNLGDEVEVEIRGEKNGFTWGAVRKPQNQAYNASASAKPNKGYSDDTTKSIVASWAIQTAVQILGQRKSKDMMSDYLNEVEALAISLIEQKNKVAGGKPVSPVAWTKEAMKSADVAQEMEIPPPADDDNLPF